MEWDICLLILNLFVSHKYYSIRQMWFSFQYYEHFEFILHQLGTNTLDKVRSSKIKLALAFTRLYGPYGTRRTPYGELN